MKKKRTMIIAGILTGTLLVCIAVPAALAKGEDESPNDAARTEITLRENDRHNAGPESGMPNGEDDISDKNTNSTKHARHGGHGENAKPEEPEAPENAIGKDAAKQIALSDVGLSSEQVEKVKARLSDKDGTLIYKVGFCYDGQKYSYKIDPVSGDILDKSVGEATEHTYGGHGENTKPEEPEAPENAIGKDAAKQIALSDAGLSSEQVEKVKARLSDKDGTLVYKVSFKYDGQRYSYKIAPVSGDILDKSVQEAAEHIREGHGEHTHADEVDAPTQVEKSVMEGI